MFNKDDKKQPEKQDPKAAPATIGRDELIRMQEHDLAQRFAVALLTNPRAEQMLGVDPLSPARLASENISAGEHLARETHRLARDYLAGLEKLTVPK